MSDWWAQRLGGQQTAVQQAPAAPSSYAAYSPTAPAQTFIGQDGRQYQMVPVGQQVQPQGPPKVTMHNLIEAMGQWTGGEGARANHKCPGCGAPAVYERGAQMAPQCYECGWNPRFGPQGQPRG